MVIKTTRYSPDTCECILEYSWDNTQSETTRTHTLSNFVNICPAHQILSTNTDRWNTIFEENPRKGTAIQKILDNSPTTALYDIINGNRQIKDSVGLTFSWSGTAPNRVLTITLTRFTLTTNQRNTIQTALNSFFGVGKVVIA